jgi:hypothetical protein
MGWLSKLFDVPDLNDVYQKLDRLNELDDHLYRGPDSRRLDLTEEEEARDQAMLEERWQIMRDLQGKVVTIDVEKVEESEPSGGFWSRWFG